MIISDLNHLEVVEAANVIGGFGEVDNINSDVISKEFLQGNVAESFGTAAAFGNNTFTKTDNNTFASTAGESLSNGASISAATK